MELCGGNGLFLYYAQFLACIISTTIDWFKGHTGPFGPKPEDWWGCGIFTIVLLLVMYWLGKKLF